MFIRFALAVRVCPCGAGRQVLARGRRDHAGRLQPRNRRDPSATLRRLASCPSWEQPLWHTQAQPSERAAPAKANVAPRSRRLPSGARALFQDWLRAEAAHQRSEVILVDVRLKVGRHLSSAAHLAVVSHIPCTVPEDLPQLKRAHGSPPSYPVLPLDPAHSDARKDHPCAMHYSSPPITTTCSFSMGRKMSRRPLSLALPVPLRAVFRPDHESGGHLAHAQALLARRVLHDGVMEHSVQYLFVEQRPPWPSCRREGRANVGQSAYSRRRITFRQARGRDATPPAPTGHRFPHGRCADEWRDDRESVQEDGDAARGVLKLVVSRKLIDKLGAEFVCECGYFPAVAQGLDVPRSVVCRGTMLTSTV